MTAAEPDADTPRPVQLHAKLLLPEADVRDLRAALSADRASSYSWSALDVEDGRLHPLEAPTVDGRLSVLVRRKPASTPRWKPFLRSLGVPLETQDEGLSESALVVVRTETEPPRTVVWCFGTASLVVPHELVDGRFGLIAALNKHAGGAAVPAWRLMREGAARRSHGGDPRARVRQLSSLVRDGYRHNVVARSTAASPVAGLRFDALSDLLRGVVVRTEDDLMPELEGGRGLKLSTYVEDWADLASLADHLVGLRNRADYREDWEWVDHVVPVAPRAKAERLLEEFARIIAEDTDVPVDIVLPELESGAAAMPDMSFGMGRGDVWCRPITWQHVRSRWLAASGERPKSLRRKVRIRSDGPDAIVEEFVLSRLLAGEFLHDGDQYVLEDGELLVVDADFLQRLDRAVEKVPLSDFPFPPYEGGIERDYLRAAAAVPESRLAYLDESPIRLPGETDFESCDLFSDDRRLVFAKRKGRSATFSHLCTQAETAAEMYLSHPATRDLLLDGIERSAAGPTIENAALEALSALEHRRADTVTITLLLLGTWRRKDLTTLPLVSRLRLQRARARITALGYRFEVASPDFAGGSRRAPRPIGRSRPSTAPTLIPSPRPAPG